MNQLTPIAQAVQSQGRGKDTQLVHMTPNEVQGLQALAKAHGGSLSINPNTGLPEAGALDSLLPTILGVGLAAATGGTSLALSPAMIGLGIGGLQYLRTGDIGKGISAGLGAWGGAGLGQGLMGVGSVANASTAAAANASPASAQYVTQAARQAATPTVAQNFSNLGTGFKSAITDPSAFLDKFPGGGMELAKYGGAAAAPMLMDMPETTTPPSDNEQYQYTYNSNRASEEDLAAQRAVNPYGELTYFRPQYQGPRMVRVAQGGELKYADGGIADGYEYDPVTRTYKKKKSAPIGAVPAIGVSEVPESVAANMPMSQQTIDFLDKEAATPGARNARIGKINDILAMLAPGAMAAKAFQTFIGATPTDRPVPVETRSVNQTPGGDTGSYQDYGDMSQRELAESGGGVGAAKGGVLRYENGGPTGAVEPIGIRGNRPMDAGYFKDMAADAARNAVISKIGQAVGISPQAMALGMAAKGVYNFFNPETPPAPVVSGSSFPSVPGQNPNGDSGGNGGYTVGDGTQGSASMSDYGGEADLAKGGLAGLANGGMSKGGFVIPADVVSALGNGSTDAGLRTLQAKIGAVKPIKGKGDGLSDSIKTSIDGKQPARVADGEAYIPPSAVAKIGGGDASKGAKKLYAMMDRVRQQAHGKKTQQRRVNPKLVV